MRIGIATLQKTTGGPKTYSFHLIKNLLDIDGENQYVIFSEDITPLEPFRSYKNVVLVQLILLSRYLRFYWDNITLPRKIQNYRIDIFHHVKNILPFSIYTKSIVTIYDMSPFLYPHSFTKLQGAYLRFFIKRAVKHSNAIITISNSSKDDILKLFPRIKENKIFVTPLGVSERFSKIEDKILLDNFRKKYNLFSKTILFLGTIQPRKNIDILIEAFGKLKKHKKIPHKLVIVGRKGWLWKEIFKIVKSSTLGSEIVFFHSVPDEDLPLFYNIADIFISVSSYEGFGLTILEAMKCQTPVISSNISSVPEVAKDGALLIEPRNTNQLTDALLSLIEDSNARERLIKKGVERTKYFSWENTARKTLEIYQGIM